MQLPLIFVESGISTLWPQWIPGFSSFSFFLSLWLSYYLLSTHCECILYALIMSEETVSGIIQGQCSIVANVSISLLSLFKKT